MEESQKKIINGQLFINHLALHRWEKNKKARFITDEKRQQLSADLKRNGIKDAFKVGEDGTIYDGNHRDEEIEKWLAEGIIQSESGQFLDWIPCTIVYPKTEAEKWDYALSRNEQFAQWSREGLEEYLPEFEDELDLSLINVDFEEQLNLDEQLTMNEETSDNEEEDNPKRKEQEVECPNCSHKFTI